MKTLRTCLLFALLCLAGCVDVAHALERDYQTAWCAEQGGKPHRLPNGTQVDCLTDTHAVEVDFAKKFYEAIGQSLYYAMHTGRKPGILLIVDFDKDGRFLLRLYRTIHFYRLNIDVFVVDKQRYLIDKPAQ